MIIATNIIASGWGIPARHNDDESKKKEVLNVKKG